MSTPQHYHMRERRRISNMLVNHCGSIEKAREYLRTHVTSDIVEQFGIRLTTLYGWERDLEQRALRQCRVCKGIFPWDRMLLNSRGQPQDGICAAEACRIATNESRGRPASSTHHERVDSEFDCVPDVFWGLTRTRLSSAEGPLSYWNQPLADTIEHCKRLYPVTSRRAELGRAESCGE